MTWLVKCLTGKYFSDALIVASTNPQYGKRLFMEIPWKLQAQNMGRTWACINLGDSMNNLLSYCGLIDANIRASDKDLPVSIIPFYIVAGG